MKFKFAVVMAIYNTSEYLSQAIDSIINQTIGFKDNIQLILVDDGSTDSSAEICLEYQEKYPDNILVLTQTNQGQAAARNNGFKYVDAKYVNFADSDDYFSLNAFEEVWNFFESHFDECDVVSVPIEFFGRLNEPHMLNGKFSKSRVIDLVREPDNPQLHTNSAFIKSDVFSRYEFPVNVVSSEDVIVLVKIFREMPFLGVVNTCKYYLRKRMDETSTLDRVNTKKEFFVDKLKDYYLYLLKYSPECPDFVKYSLLYDLQWLVREDLSILDDLEVREFYRDLYEILDYIDMDIILNSANIVDERYRQFLVFLKTGDLHTEVVDGDVLIKIGDYMPSSLKSHKFWFDIVDIRDDVLRVSGFINSIINYKYFSVQAIKYVGDVEVGRINAAQVKYTARPDVYFLDKLFQYKFNFDAEIPLVKGEISKIRFQLTYHKDGDNSNFDSSNTVEMWLRNTVTTNVKLSELSKYKISRENILYFNNNAFHVIPNYFKSHVKREMDNIDLLKKQFDDLDYIQREYGLDGDDLSEIIRLRRIYLLTLPFFRFIWKNREIYLFEDRIDVADDNAYHLFKHATGRKDNVKKYFVLSDKSKQFSKLKKIGKVLKFGSLKHKLMILHADKIITTHPYDTVLNPFFREDAHDQRPLISGLLNYKIYWLQHGVTKDNISSWLYKYEKDLSLIATVSDMESESFLDEGYGYSPEIIQNLGFPRFDNLEKKDSKQILIIPTWRKQFSENKDLFLESDYFKNLNSFLNSPSLKNSDYRVVFKPHPELLKSVDGVRFIDLFDIPDNVHLAVDESYQDLLNSSSVLITDYSSVFFDFAYLKKPVIYYHPSDDYHYDKSYFDYETMGFGEVVRSEVDLISKLSYYIDNGCEMENEYKKRVDKFFTYSDRYNSKRVYDWILKN